MLSWDSAMTDRDYREIRVGDILRHPRMWAWGRVISFAPNGKPRVRRLDGKYRDPQYRHQVFPSDSVVCYLYDYDDHIKKWWLYNELRAFRKRVGRHEFNRVIVLIDRQRRKIARISLTRPQGG